MTQEFKAQIEADLKEATEKEARLWERSSALKAEIDADPRQAEYKMLNSEWSAQYNKINYLKGLLS